MESVRGGCPCLREWVCNPITRQCLDAIWARSRGGRIRDFRGSTLLGGVATQDVLAPFGDSVAQREWPPSSVFRFVCGTPCFSRIKLCMRVTAITSEAMQVRYQCLVRGPELGGLLYRHAAAWSTQACHALMHQYSYDLGLSGDFLPDWEFPQVGALRLLRNKVAAAAHLR